MNNEAKLKPDAKYLSVIIPYLMFVFLPIMALQFVLLIVSYALMLATLFIMFEQIINFTFDVVFKHLNKFDNRARKYILTKFNIEE